MSEEPRSFPLNGRTAVLRPKTPEYLKLGSVHSSGSRSTFAAPRVDSCRDGALVPRFAFVFMVITATGRAVAFTTHSDTSRRMVSGRPAATACPGPCTSWHQLLLSAG